MSLRPFRNINRKKTRVINVGDVKIGGDNPISVQSMTNTLTTDVKATIDQINAIHEEGADIVRVSRRPVRYRAASRPSRSSSRSRCPSARNSSPSLRSPNRPGRRG